jgi:hypothetical protein
MRLLSLLVVLGMLSGCATPIMNSQTIPVYSGKAPVMAAIAVTDHRSFIVNNNKKEWFEGIFRGAFGIPHSLARPGVFNEKPFALFLANKLKTSLEGAGANVLIVQVPKGTPAPDAIKRMTDSQTRVGLLVEIHQSRYDIGLLNPEYGYSFKLVVVSPSGQLIGQKAFHGMDQKIELSTKYNVFDMMSEIYKKKFESFLNDQDIKTALDAAVTIH